MATHPSNGHPASPGITRISVTGFKSLVGKTEVEIRPLTVLAGANSSGKSSLMQPLLLMKQTLESDVNPAGPFRLSGPYTSYTESRQFLSLIGSEIETRPHLRVDFEFGRMTAGFTFAPDPSGSFAVIATRGSQAGAGMRRPWEIRSDSSPEDLRLLDLPWEMVHSAVGLAEYRVIPYKYFLGIQASLSSVASYSKSQGYELWETLALNAEIRKLIHVPGLRGDQNRKWLLANVPAAQPFAVNTFEGPFEGYVPSLIHSWQDSPDRLKITQLNADLGSLDLAYAVRAERLNESEIEVHVPRTAKSEIGDYVNIADVGLAVSAALPVLVALIQAEPEQLVYIEQPELHLHPGGQWKLAQLLVQAANRGVRLVIETHSALLLRGILTCVGKGEISPGNVALHWFARNESGVTKVTTAVVDAQGRFGDWPADFDDVELTASSDYLDAVESTLTANRP